MTLGILFAISNLPAEEPAAPAPSAEIVRETERLIGDLGSSEFAKRQAAAKRLREIGLPALEPLRTALKHPSLEVSSRARRLLVDVERLEQERRIAIYLKDPQNADDALLPGLKRFRELVGRESATSQLFIEMHRAEPALFQAMRISVKEAEAAYETRCGELQFEYNALQNRSRVAERVCAILLCGADPDLSESDQAAQIVYGFVHWAEFRNAMQSQPNGPAIRKLIGGWIRKSSGTMAYQKLMLGFQLDIPETVTPAVEICKANLPGGQAQYAVLAIGRFGGRDQLPMLEKMLNDRTVLSTSTVNNKPAWTSEMRDVVLAVLVHLTKQEHKDYGFKNLQKHQQYLYAPNTAGFEKPEDRTAALKKWEDWRAANPQPPEANAAPKP